MTIRFLLRHIYAFAALILAAVYTPHWAFPTAILMLYVVDVVHHLLAQGEKEDAPVADPWGDYEDTLVDASSPTPAAFPSSEGLPVHDVYQLQKQLDLPPSAEITIDDNTDNPWNRALQQIRSGELDEDFDADTTTAYSDDFNPAVFSDFAANANLEDTP